MIGMIVWAIVLIFLASNIFVTYPELFWIAAWFIPPLILLPIINGHP